MIKAHYINPYIQGNSCSFDLLLTLDDGTQIRTSKQFIDNGLTEDEFTSMLTLAAHQSLNAHLSSLLDPETEFEPSNAQVDEVEIDWPIITYTSPTPTSTQPGLFGRLWERFKGLF